MMAEPLLRKEISMAYRQIDPETGFIEYKRTAEETSILNMKRENEYLRKQVEKLSAMIKGQNNDKEG